MSASIDSEGWPRSWEVVAILVGCLSIVVFLLASYVEWGIVHSLSSTSESASTTVSSNRFSMTRSASSASIPATHPQQQDQPNQNQHTSTSQSQGSQRRKGVFNLYLFFIILPDAIVNGFHGFSLIWQGTGTHDGLLLPGICIVRDSLGLSYFYSNIYLNMFVGREIYTIVLASYQRQRVDPPSIPKCLAQVAASYLIGAAVALWYTMDLKASPFTLYDRQSCDWKAESQVFNNLTSSIVAFAIVFPPLGYVFWVWFRVWKRKLLPLRGRTRMIALYFCRIVVVFLGFSFPAMMMSTIRTWLDPVDYRTARYWTHMMYFLMIPMQCLVTLRIAIENIEYFRPAVQQRQTHRQSSISGIDAADIEAPQSESVWKASFFFCPSRRNAHHHQQQGATTEEDSS